MSVVAQPLQPPLILDPGDPIANARSFAATHYRHRGQTTLLHHADEWRAWTGSHYPMVDEPTIRARLWDFFERAYKPGPKGQPVPFKPTSARVTNAIDALRAVCNLPTRITPPAWLRTSKLSADAMIAFTNGLLHLPTCQLHPHDPAFFAVNARSFDYDADAGCPEWLRFLEDLWDGDQAAIDALQEWFAYVLTTDPGCTRS
jgi:putative DNA primase/helicase